MKDETAGLLAGVIVVALIGAAAYAHGKGSRAVPVGRIAVPVGSYGRPRNASLGREDIDALTDAVSAVFSVARATSRILRACRSMNRVFRD